MKTSSAPILLLTLSAVALAFSNPFTPEQAEAAEQPAATAAVPAAKKEPARAAPRVAVATAPVGSPKPAVASLADLIEQAMPSVVTIRTQEDGGNFQPTGWRQGGPPGPEAPGEGSGTGSGIILSADGYILTNHHVVRGSRVIEVVFHHPQRKLVAQLVGSDEATDVAVLKVDATDLPAASFSDGATLRVGDGVVAIGSPFGLVQSATTGIVSALGRADLRLTSYEDFIQTDASINPGNSGGALLDARTGEVIGVNTAIYSRTGGNVGIGFAIPARMAQAVARQIVEHGSVRRGYLGIGIEDASDGGALVREVSPGGAAELAGLKAGDVVVTAGGRSVKNAAALRLAVAELGPDVTLDMVVKRGGVEQTLTATTTLMADVGTRRDSGSEAEGPRRREGSGQWKSIPDNEGEYWGGPQQEGRQMVPRNNKGYTDGRSERYRY